MANLMSCPVCGQSYDIETDMALCDCTTAEKTIGVELQRLQNQIQSRSTFATPTEIQLCEVYVATIRSALMRMVATRR
jgi:hypothetical protein